MHRRCPYFCIRYRAVFLFSWRSIYSHCVNEPVYFYLYLSSGRGEGQGSEAARLVGARVLSSERRFRREVSSASRHVIRLVRPSDEPWDACQKAWPCVSWVWALTGPSLKHKQWRGRAHAHAHAHARTDPDAGADTRYSYAHSSGRRH